MINRTPSVRTPFGLKGPAVVQVSSASMQSLHSATQDNGEDDGEITKDPMITSFQQVKASTGTTAALVEKFEDQVSDDSDIEKMLQKEKMSVIDRETWVTHKSQ